MIDRNQVSPRPHYASSIDHIRRTHRPRWRYSTQWCYDRRDQRSSSTSVGCHRWATRNFPGDVGVFVNLSTPMTTSTRSATMDTCITSFPGSDVHGSGRCASVINTVMRHNPLHRAEVKLLSRQRFRAGRGRCQLLDKSNERHSQSVCESEQPASPRSNHGHIDRTSILTECLALRYLGAPALPPRSSGQYSAETVRLLLASDLHYSLRQFDWIVARSDFDVVVLAGDHLDISSPVAMDAADRCGAAVLRLAGSDRSARGELRRYHDLTGEDHHEERAALWLQEAREGGFATDGESLMIGGPSHHDLPVVGRPDRTRTRCRCAARRGGCRTQRRPARWIWVYHWPPLGSPTRCLDRPRSAPRRRATSVERIEQPCTPDVVLTGHVHDPPFASEGAWADRFGTTWVLQRRAGQIGPVPARIRVSLD